MGMIVKTYTTLTPLVNYVCVSVLVSSVLASLRSSMCTLRTSSVISSRLVTAARWSSPSCSPDPGPSVLVDVTNLGAGVPGTGEVVFTTEGDTEYYDGEYHQFHHHSALSLTDAFL